MKIEIKCAYLEEDGKCALGRDAPKQCVDCDQIEEMREGPDDEFEEDELDFEDEEDGRW